MSRRFACCLLLAAFPGIVLPARGAAEEAAPRLAQLLADARIVASGRVDSVQEYADGRLVVAELRVEKPFKGRLPSGTDRISIIESRELPTPRIFAAGDRGIAFLAPAARSTFVVQTLPPGTYYELTAKSAAFLEAASDAEMTEIDGAVGRMLGASRAPDSDVGRRAESSRAFTFDLIAAHHPRLVEEGAARLGDIAGLAATLGGEEQRRLEAALARPELALSIRLAIVEAIAGTGLKQLVPALQRLDSPPELMEASWNALARLGAAPSEKQLTDRLGASDPAVRAAAARELLRLEGAAAVSQVAPVALQDPEESVRLATVDALGKSKMVEALPPLERVFSERDGELRQAAGRAIWTIGGDAAADTLARLAVNAPSEAQRQAIGLLIFLKGKTDSRVEQLAKTHPNAQIRDWIEHGPSVHKH